MSTIDERNVDPVQEMTRIAQSYLDLDWWGFQESFRAFKPGKLIFDSEWCRLSLIWGGWDPRGGNSISIYYGRLHAPNEKTTMIWNDEECHCWHRFELALHFLDKRTPEYASKMIYTHSLIEQYKRSELGQSLTEKRRQPEWLAQMHVTIWQHYSKRLFELFDLRRPDLWQQYRQFLKEVYDIEGRIPEIEPSLDKVC
jgi:hypothetical protein